MERRWEDEGGEGKGRGLLLGRTRWFVKEEKEKKVPVSISTSLFYEKSPTLFNGVGGGMELHGYGRAWGDELLWLG